MYFYVVLCVYKIVLATSFPHEANVHKHDTFKQRIVICMRMRTSGCQTMATETCKTTNFTLSFALLFICWLAIPCIGHFLLTTETSYSESLRQTVRN